MGQVFVVDGTEVGGYVDQLVPAAVAQLARGALGTREQVQAEIDVMLAAVRDFWQLPPDQVMLSCAAYCARVTELEVQLHRIEAVDRTYKQVRTMQIHPLLEELDRQFKIASRLVEVRRQDLETSRAFT